jgi:hypothetical protein
MGTAFVTVNGEDESSTVLELEPGMSRRGIGQRLAWLGKLLNDAGEQVKRDTDGDINF